MCISTVSHRNRTRCTGSDEIFYYSSLIEVEEWTGTREANCSIRTASIIINELDVTNIVRELKFNYTDGMDFGNFSVSNYDFFNTLWLVRPTWEVAVKSFAVAPVMVIGIIVNLILLVVLARYRRLHTPTNMLVGSLAVADLATLLFCPWMLLINHFYQNFILGPVGCKVEGFLAAALLITSVLNLSAISYDRLTAIVLPQEARMSRTAALRLAFISWIVGFSFAMPLSVWRHYKERQWRNFLEMFCAEDPQVLPMYWHVLIFMLVWLPLSIMTICYSAIFWKLDRYQRQILRREHPLSVSYKTRVARTIFIILVAFIACRLPFTVLVFWRSELMKEGRINSVDNGFHIMWFISHYLMYVNCAINPIIYGLTNENYKRALGSMTFYKWLSGMSSKNMKDDHKMYKKDIEKKEKNDEKKPSWKYGFWLNGRKITFPSDKDILENNKSDTPKIVSCKISPLEPDFI